MMIATSPMAIMKLPAATEGMQKYGYPESSMVVLGIAELVSALLYVIPKTSILGAILLTGYLGGAVATHVRASEATYFIPILFGVLFWAGLWCRNPTLRALIPYKQN